MIKTKVNPCSNLYKSARSGRTGFFQEHPTHVIELMGRPTYVFIIVTFQFKKVNLLNICIFWPKHINYEIKQ